MKYQGSKEHVGKGPAFESLVLHSFHSWCAEASQAPWLHGLFLLLLIAKKKS